MLCSCIHLGFVAEAVGFQILCHRKLFYMLIYHDMPFLGYSPFFLFSSVCLDMNMTVSNIACGSFTLNRRLQVGHWNLNGLMSKQFGSKLELDEVLKTI